MKDRYEVIADIEELRWFFENVLYKPAVNEAYQAVLAARFKKLTEEERAEVGIAKNESEFLMTQTFRLKGFKRATDLDTDDGWNFETFLKKLRRFNVDQQAYLTTGGYPLPEKCLTTLIYVNPCDEIKVADEIMRTLEETKTAIVKAMLNGKTLDANLQSYQVFSNIDGKLKRARAHCKGSSYWLDFDLDCPEWFKSTNHEKVENKYFAELKVILNTTFGTGSYLLVDTSGGYHIMVRTKGLHCNPRNFCTAINDLYLRAITADKMPPYVDNKGNHKFECILNDCQIPGLPLPGTFQYGRPVKIVNKEDFKP
jgi:hypothetical protein